MSVKHQKHQWRVAVVSNLKDKNLSHMPGLPPDAFAEFDSIETVRLIQKTIEADGHQTELLLADKNLPRTLEKYKPHICFNDSEGIQGDAREAQTPALMELLNIPYTHSRILTAAEGILYEDLILEILYLAAGRWGLLEPHEQPSVKKSSKETVPSEPNLTNFGSTVSGGKNTEKSGEPKFLIPS